MWPGLWVEFVLVPLFAERGFLWVLLLYFSSLKQEKPVVDPGEGGPGPPLLLDQTEAPRGKKIFFWRLPPRLLKGLDDCPPPPPSPLSQLLSASWANKF